MTEEKVILNTHLTYLNRVVLTLFLWAIVAVSFAQDTDGCLYEPSKKSKKAYDNVKESDEAMGFRRKALRELVEIDPQYIDAHYMLARYTFNYCKANYKPFDKPMEMYKQVIKLCPTYHSNPYYHVGRILHAQKKYKEAIVYLEGFKNFDAEGKEKYDRDRKYNEKLEEVKGLLEDANFYVDQFENPVPFDPVLMEGVSTGADEFLSIIAPDGESIYFTRRKFNVRSKNIPFTTDVEEFCKSEMVNGKFIKGKPMTAPFNMHDGNSGGTSVSINNKELFFTVCFDGFCDIYTSKRFYNHKILDMDWSKPKKMGTQINTEQWESQPCISGDGKTLYFASARGPAGLGGTDIYKSVRDSTGKWGEAVNLGAPINTPGNEKTPFFHVDGMTMYFASSDREAKGDAYFPGHRGLGGFDLFFSKFNEKDSTWSEPKNLGYPINSEGNEYGFYVSTDGATGFFSSDQLDGPGGLDLYSFPLYKEARPEKVMFLKGKLRDENGNPIKNAMLELRGSKSNKILKIDVDSTDGAYAMVMKLDDEDEDFILSVKGKGLAFNSKLISAKDTTYSPPATVDFDVKTIKVGGSYQLNDIYFETDSAVLTAKSQFVITEFIAYLKFNKSITIGIYGHTDSIGDANYNLELSRQRAEQVNNYLVAEGINQKRIKFAGRGAFQPIAPNKTEVGRARNRRTEFKILSK